MPTLTQAIQAARLHSSVDKQADDLTNTRNALIASYGPTLASDAKRKALLDALKWIGVGGAGGFALRGLQGMVEQPRRNLRAPVESLSTPTTVDIPVQEEHKLAGVVDWITHPIQSAKDTLKSVPEGAKWLGEAALGKHVTDPQSHPAWLPLAVGGGAAAGLGGYKLHDMIIEKLRKNQLEAELEQAKKDYQGALMPKAASDDSLAADLDDLCNAIEKVAEGEEGYQNAGGNMIGSGVGAYALWALLTGGLGAGASYNHFKKKQRRALLEEAQKKRRRQMFQAHPTPLYARSVPVESPEPVETPEPFKAAPSLSMTEDQIG